MITKEQALKYVKDKINQLYDVYKLDCLYVLFYEARETLGVIRFLYNEDIITLDERDTLASECYKYEELSKRYETKG